jgi:hypothetical protein
MIQLKMNASDYFPVKRGGRFSMKARTPSLWSAVCTAMS